MTTFSQKLHNLTLLGYDIDIDNMVTHYRCDVEPTAVLDYCRIYFNTPDMGSAYIYIKNRLNGAYYVCIKEQCRESEFVAKGLVTIHGQFVTVDPDSGEAVVNGPLRDVYGSGFNIRPSQYMPILELFHGAIIRIMSHHDDMYCDICMNETDDQRIRFHQWNYRPKRKSPSDPDMYLLRISMCPSCLEKTKKMPEVIHAACDEDILDGFYAFCPELNN
jgi:hypothetical protein